MRRYIPQFLKYPLISLYIFWHLLLKGKKAKGIVVNLVGVLPPEGSKVIIHGGKPKFLHIREKFGDSWKHFNIAYFGSSSLPFAPKIWIRLYKLFGVKVAWNQNGVAYPALYSPEVVEHINTLLSPIHLCDYVIYQSEFVKRCADIYLGKFKGPSTVIINPVDTTKFKPRDLPLENEPLTIIMLGNHFESRERMEVSIDALKILRNKGMKLKLILIGTPDYEINEDWIEKLGPYLQEKAPQIFQAAHLFLHLKYLDPCPITVIEALSSGLPVVGQRNGGMPELVGEEAGILLSVPDDYESLHYPTKEDVAQAIENVSQNLSHFRQEARKRALQFDKEPWLKKHEEIFTKLLDEE